MADADLCCLHPVCSVIIVNRIASLVSGSYGFPYSLQLCFATRTNTMFPILVLLLVISASCLRRLDDICTHHASRRLYLELGETGVLTGFNVTASSAARQLPGRFYSNVTSHEQCVVEIVTCPACVINVVFRHLDLSHTCSGGNLLMDSPCRCDYVWISEPPYEDVSGAPYCGVSDSGGSNLNYKSKTRTLNIALLFSEAHQHAFTLEYTAERNRQYLVGSPGSLFSVSNVSTSGVITSPFFPSPYPRDLGVEYVISCAVDSQVEMPPSPPVPGKYDPSCRVRLIFSDFQVAFASVIEFFDGNNQRIEVTSGSSFRPPVILSSGASLAVRFYANGGSGLGFKAIYSFVTGNYVEKSVKPSTDCGGYVENFGGAITMMNMVDRGVKSYDCVWLIRPPENFLHLKTHLYLKVATFADFAGSTELQIRPGLTSQLPVVETLLYPVSQMHQQRSKEHIISINSGYYVSLKGSFGPASRLAVTYTSFSYNKCFAGSEFLCQNHRCIPGKLSCDGFDHCGDNTDEPASCYQEWEMEPLDRRWYSHTPNYYFPKMERYPDLKTATLVFVVSSLGLILLISALIVLLYRMGTRARQQRELQNRLQTISELLDGARIEEIVTPDDPPDYEAPPDYDEVIKVRVTPNKTRRKRKPATPSRRSRSSPGERRNSTPAPPLLEVVLPQERPRTRTQYLNTPDQPDSLTSQVSHASQGSFSSQMPDSPPPPYSTEELFKFTTGALSADENIIIGTPVVTSVTAAGGNEAAARRQSWQVFPEDSVDQADPSTHLRHQSADVIIGGEEVIRKPKRRTKRSQSCCTRLQSWDQPRAEETVEGRRASLEEPAVQAISETEPSQAIEETVQMAANTETSLSESSVLDIASSDLEPPSQHEVESVFCQLDAAIENQLQDLMFSCSVLPSPTSPVPPPRNFVLQSPTSTAASQPNTDAETYYLSSLEPEISGNKSYQFYENDWEVNFNATRETTGKGGDKIGDDKYWEEFDKQFQYPNRKYSGTIQRRDKVANLSRRYEKTVFTTVHERGRRESKDIRELRRLKKSQRKERKSRKGLQQEQSAAQSAAECEVECECAGACGCATSSAAVPVRKRKRIRRKAGTTCGDSSDCEGSSESTMDNFLDND